VAEGQRQATVLASQATMQQTVNVAKGDAEAILQRATATAKGVELLAGRYIHIHIRIPAVIPKVISAVDPWSCWRAASACAAARTRCR